MLDVEGSQPDGPEGRLANDRKGLQMNVLEGFALRQPVTELGRLGVQLIVGELLEQRLELVDVGNPLEVPFGPPEGGYPY